MWAEVYRLIILYLINSVCMWTDDTYTNAKPQPLYATPIFKLLVGVSVLGGYNWAFNAAILLFWSACHTLRPN